MNKRTTLILAISLPFAMVIILGIITYLPGLFIKPQYDFLYSMSNHFIYGIDVYSIQNEKLSLMIQDSNDGTYGSQDMKFYIYHTADNSSSEISYEKAQELRLDSKISADGYEVINGKTREGIFPFSYSIKDYDSYYIRNSNASRKLNINTSSDYNNFNFIGWIKK